MPSVRYDNQTGPFWDFVAGLEQQGINRPADSSDNEHEQPIPWAQGWAGFPWGQLPHRGRHGPPPHHHRGPPPPPPQAESEEGEAGPSEPRGPPPPFSDTETEGQPQHGHQHHGPGARGGRCGRGRGGPRGFGRRGHFHPYGRFGPFGQIAELFQEQLFGAQNDNNNSTKDTKSEDFTPEVDVFDTAESFVVHISLPGAKKEDVGVNWDTEKSELSIAGVVYRPGDEELLKTLALDERKVGAFERKVRLGSRANPAQIDVDGIAARLEDGVLRVEVPKLDAGYVEIKKVDIE
ncbi:hypothetical protein CBER1_02878 [Cercospora berteroae]|uniref:SHSP domain-containing protein n=1 Tax=Cercospora berteroae TaxID=357750 RepID=A0A2S6BQF7_9PEZI|nr:hypothetical protein CBER1_02878 [Cercospora berteroae]